MEEQKPKLDWKHLLITTAIVLVAAGAVGGTTYYVLNQNFQKERDANQKALDDVNAQLKAEEAKDKVSKTEKAATTTTATKTVAIRSFSSQQLADAINSYNSATFPKSSRVAVVNDGSLGDWISNTLYGDLNVTGKEDFAIVTVTSSGSGANKTLYVLAVQSSLPKVISYVLPPTNGHNSFALNGTTLSETYPIYKAGDPNCCPSGGNGLETYKWNGTSFVKQ